MNANTNTLWLIDGSSFLYRAFYALPPLTNSQGAPTGAILGVCNMLKNLLELHEPEHIAVVFDPPGNTRRHTIFPEYKANRGETPADLSAQVAPLFAIIRAMGLPLLQVAGEEADDVIGTIAHLAKKAGHSVIICTSDKDFAQLVDPHITLLNTMNQKQLDHEGVVAKFGLPPEQIIDFLALTGDSVDNIPGIPKVGPKTAVKWLTEYGSLADLMAHSEDIGGKVGEHLRAHQDKLPLYQKLVTIDTHMSLPFTFESIQRTQQDSNALLDLITPLEFRRWIEQLKSSMETTPDTTTQTTTFTCQIIADQASFDDLLVALKAAKYIAFDLETDGLDTLCANLVGIALAMDENGGYYIPIQHPDSQPPWDAASILAQLMPILNQPQSYLIGHNLKFDLKVLLRHGITVHTPIIDTLLMSYVANSAQRSHSMDHLATTLLGTQTTSFSELTQQHQADTMDQVPVDAAANYAIEDVVITWRLWRYFCQTQAEQPHYVSLLQTVEWPLVKVLAHMEHRGVLIDETMLAQQSTKLAEQLDACTQEAHDALGYAFNLASPKQLRGVLFETLQLPILKKTPKGEPSTSEEALEALRDHHPLPNTILSHRHMSKLKNTYTDRLPEQIHPHTHRVHCEYNQAVTSTGRLSSHHPNLQNIPIRTTEGRAIRQAFIAPPDHTLLCADYSQIELRIMAHWSQEPALIEAFQNDWDIHQSTASELFNIPLNQVNTEQRRFAKTINFGLIYGMSSWGLSQQLAIGRKEADHYIAHYFARYPGVKRYMEQTKALAHEQGFVETLLGRRIDLPDIRHANKQKQMGAERAAINGPMQGSAADIIKLAMIETERALNGQPATMIMQVHDELVFEVHQDHLDAIRAIIETTMTSVVSLNTPLKVNLGHGPNWDVAH